jgi:ABC-type transport system involved in multi-copper enzyme maturation permease subunit
MNPSPATPTSPPNTTTTDHEDRTMTTTEAPIPRSAGAARATEATEATSTISARPPGLLRTLPSVLRGEWIKATTVRANKVLLAVAAAMGLLVSWATAAFTDDAFAPDGALTAMDVFVVPTLLTAVLAAVAGILLFTTEVQHGTLAGALTAHPTRWPVVAGKVIVAAGFGVLLGVIGLVTGFAGAMAGGVEVGATSGVASLVAWALLYTVGSAVLGLGVGMVVRHSAAAVAGLLVWWLVVEGLIVSFAPPEAARFVPFDTGFRTLGVESEFDAPERLAAGLANGLHASIFWGYVLVALAIGAALLVRRDID